MRRLNTQQVLTLLIMPGLPYSGPTALHFDHRAPLVASHCVSMRSDHKIKNQKQDHTMQTTTQPNLATVHPRLACTALER